MLLPKRVPKDADGEAPEPHLDNVLVRIVGPSALQLQPSSVTDDSIGDAAWPHRLWEAALVFVSLQFQQAVGTGVGWPSASRAHIIIV